MFTNPRDAVRKALLVSAVVFGAVPGEPGRPGRAGNEHPAARGPGRAGRLADPEERLQEVEEKVDAYKALMRQRSLQGLEGLPQKEELEKPEGEK